MTDKELEQYVLAVDVWTFCVCRGHGKVKCKAHQRLLTLARDVHRQTLTEVLATIANERLSGETRTESDAAYNLALEHAIDAMRESQQFGEQT